MDRDTIAAIATAPGGGVGMIRISGPRALTIAGRIFTPANEEKSPVTMPGYTGAFGRIGDEGGILDEGVLYVYRAPHSYTGEDCVEITCHGGAYVMSRVFSAAVTVGARPAEPGEYTRRALMNGKMSLTQAESVVDIIGARNNQSLRAAMSAMDGALFRTVREAGDALTDACAHIAAWIDYPEEDVEEVATPELRESLQKVQDTLLGLQHSYEQGRMVREGISCAIIGSANVGKSTLMNLLSGREKSIVTEIPGTTRDVIEESVRLGELTLNLRDTAGLRDSDDPVEQIGVRRSREVLSQSDLILLVFDRSMPLTEEQRELLGELRGRATIAVFNKSDLPSGMSDAESAEIVSSVLGSVTLSARTGEGLTELEAQITEVVGLSHFDANAAMIANARQLSCVVSAQTALRDAINALDAGQTLDAVSVCLQDAADALLTLSGKRASAEMIDKVFEQFCVGK